MIGTRRSLLRSPAVVIEAEAVQAEIADTDVTRLAVEIVVPEVEAVQPEMTLNPWIVHMFGREVVMSTHVVPWMRRLISRVKR